jgi:hypothetical protein
LWLFYQPICITFLRFYDLSRHNYPYYLYRDDIAAMDWLETNATEDSVVLSSQIIGEYIPALTVPMLFLHTGANPQFF